MVSVRIPTPLRGHVGGASSVELAGATVGEVLRELAQRHEKLHGRLFNEQGELNRFVNVFLNDEDIRFLQGLDTPLKDGDGVVLVPAIAGGSGAGEREGRGAMRTAIRSWMGLGLALLLAGAPGALADKKDKKDKGKQGAAGVSVTVTFTTDQRGAAQGWYTETYGRGNCPPGLAKKNNGCLPPGQAKKRYVVGQPLGTGVTYKPISPELSVRIGKPPDGYIYVTLDGDLLKLAVGTLLVVDAIDGLLN